VLIKRWVPEYEQNLLWSHTRNLRDRRQPILINLESQPEFEFVRKRSHAKVGFESTPTSGSSSSTSTPPIITGVDHVQEPRSQEEAERLMDEFLATFTVDDGNKATDHVA